MPASHPDKHVSCEQLPPLAAEDHTCNVCALVYSKISIDNAVSVTAGLPAAVREAVCAIQPEAGRVRPGPLVWSVAEYLCHLRDVYVTYTIRLHRTRTEDRPALEPMFNDLRARRFRYNYRDLNATVDELARLRPASVKKSRARENGTGTASRPGCRASSVPRVGSSGRRCMRVFITSAISAESPPPPTTVNLQRDAGVTLEAQPKAPEIWL